MQSLSYSRWPRTIDNEFIVKKNTVINCHSAQGITTHLKAVSFKLLTVAIHTKHLLPSTSYDLCRGSDE